MSNKRVYAIRWVRSAGRLVGRLAWQKQNRWTVLANIFKCVHSCRAFRHHWHLPFSTTLISTVLCHFRRFVLVNRFVGLVVKASASGAEDPGFKSHLRRDFSGSSHTSDLKIGTPVATLPGAWHYRVSAGTSRPDVSILWLGEVESLICNFYLSVAARKIVWADPSLRYTSMLLGR